MSKLNFTLKRKLIFISLNILIFKFLQGLAFGILITFSFLPNLYSQSDFESIPDSIFEKLDTLNSTIDKVDYLNLTSRALIRSNPELSFKINDYAQTIAEEYYSQNLRGLIKMERGILHSMLSDHSAARPFFKEAAHHYRMDKDSMRLGYVYRNLALGFSRENMQDSALNACFESLYYLDRNNEDHKEFLTLTLNSLANILYHNNSYRTSIQYAEAGAELAAELNDNHALASAYNTIGLNLLELDDVGSFDFLKKAYDINVLRNDSVNIIITIHNYGVYLLEVGRPQEALDTLLSGYKQSLNVPANRTETYYKATIAKAYFEIGNYEKAEEYLVELADAYEEKQELSPYGTIFETLSKLREKQGRYKEALQYILIANKIEVDGLTLENETLVNIRERDLEYNKKLKKLNYLQTTNELNQKELILKNRNLLLLWIVIIGLLIISALLFYFIRKINQSKARIEKINRELSAQSIDLKELNQSKENLISIIGHDLRGPLGNLKELLYLVPNEEDKISPESLNILGLGRSSVEQMNDLLANLLIWAKSQKRKLLIDQKRFALKAVVDRVHDLYSSFLSFQNIELINNIDHKLEVFADPDTVEIVIRNLVNNSIKFSKPDSKILLTAFQEGNHVLCVLEDHAGGIPDKVVNTLFNNGNQLNAQEAAMINGGFGLKLSQELLVANGAHWSYEKTKDGSKIIIHFPINSQ